MSARKDMKALLRQARRQGFTITYNHRGHQRVRNPATGQRAVVSATPSDGRAVRNARADLRRIGLQTR